MLKSHTYALPARIFFLILLSVYLVKQVRCGHVVGFASLGFVSHHRVLWKLGKELQMRGHKYTHISPSFAKESYDDVDVKRFNSSVTRERIEDWFVRYASLMGDTKDMFALFKLFTKIGPERGQILRQFCEDFLKHESLIAELKASVDLVLCDVANDCCFILADMLNATRVDVSTIGFSGIVGAYLFDYPQAPVYRTLQASILLPSASKFSFINRLKGFVYYAYTWNGLISLIQPEDLWEKYGKAHSKFMRAADARRVHGIALIPHDFALEQSQPLGANIKVIGALSPEPARRLPEYLDKYMSENKVVVIVSFGTIFSSYPTGLAQTIADELSQVSAAVLWKYSGVMPKNLGKNIKIIPWFPKNECSFNDILGHSSTKVFVTHGGVNGYQESVYHGVPMVVIPMFADQPRQAKLVQYKELGVAVEWKSINAKDKVLQNAINKVLNNKVYEENTKRLSTIMKDRKQSASQEGADWIEYALRHDGAPHLTSEAIDLPQYKLHMFDVFIFLVLVACLVVYALLRLCCCILCACGRKIHVKEKQT